MAKSPKKKRSEGVRFC